MTKGKQRYLIQEQPLGGGHFGTVYRAIDTKLDIVVAIKMPNDPEKEEALDREARLMARVRKVNVQHVVLLHDVEEIHGKTCIVMEFLPKSLRDFVGRIESHPHPPVAVEKALDWGIQICEGLEVLHGAFGEAQIFHRDIKPENILFKVQGGSEIAKIADFGISAVLERSGVASTAIGTRPYMSPEQLGYCPGGADCRSDIYSVGVTLYETLTGRLPYNPFDNFGNLKAEYPYMQEIGRGNAPTPAEIANVDKALSDTVMKAMHHNVQERWQAINELREGLFKCRSLVSVDSVIASALKQGAPGAQERALREVVTRFPRDPKPYRNLAWLYNGQHRFCEARQVLEEARRNCPECVEVAIELADSLIRAGEVGDAVRILEEAARKDMPPQLQRRADVLLKACRKRLSRKGN
jgi:serine/threonine protein kinase